MAGQGWVEMTSVLPDDCLMVDPTSLVAGFDKEAIRSGFWLFDGHGCDHGSSKF